MDSIKQRIVSYVKANQPVSVADMIRDLSIGRSRYYEEAKTLRRLGMLRSVSGIGVFAWTELKPFAMGKFREWQLQHSPCCVTNHNPEECVA
ncbi:TPA: hypothetical protein I8372_001463 [Citrobacter farmeri]|nr:hypothetical protein [Citrobacter farmeri]HAT2776359.1 hypothetical protein [Citrobacter farmeri]HAT2807324.1 hypothetical protein [Citrobacter farmeri]HBC0547140.1 hypothetical protein [Citrobacter farmeri]